MGFCSRGINQKGRLRARKSPHRYVAPKFLMFLRELDNVSTCTSQAAFLVVLKAGHIGFCSREMSLKGRARARNSLHQRFPWYFDVFEESDDVSTCNRLSCLFIILLGGVEGFCNREIVKACRRDEGESEEVSISSI
jgi:hypothetical protein